MSDNIINAPPELQAEITSALTVLKKKGYRVNVEEGAAGELLLHFRFGENEQTLKVTRDERQKAGTVEKHIVDKLDI
jgi:hypothetical protein